MSKNDVFSLLNSKPEIKQPRAHTCFVYVSITLVIAILWFCNYHSWARLTLLIAIPSLLVAFVIVLYYPDRRARWMHSIVIESIAVHTSLILSAIVLWNKVAVLRQVTEMSGLVGLVIVVIEVPIFAYVLKRHLPRDRWGTQ